MKCKTKKYMAGGPMSGLAKAAEMSGRTMPVTGAPMSPGATGLARAAEMSGRTMPVTGRRMATGGKVTRGDGACMKGHTKGRMV